jgi:exodeoxyribonuclease VII large subunit
MTTPELTHNLPELSVGQLSSALQRTVETAFPRVRVRGEISGFKRAPSGHLYLNLKDPDAVLGAVCWKGVAARLAIRPEDGMEVIATGKLTTFAGQSKYQLVIDQMELAGRGALLALIEDRKRRLAAEGLFEAARKRPLPLLPRVIGVITSPTGAVIRDILHRLNDRFPRPVLVWPVLVQGEQAAAQIVAAIEGFNRLVEGGRIPRPDVLIVARGGGSIEDLMAFNDEAVVRAAAASAIPLISAVGHETDTTLIDFASDRRAPTPTAAAEMAVPVRADLRQAVTERGQRLDQAAERILQDRNLRLDALGRGLTDPRRAVAEARQRLEDRGQQLHRSMRQRLALARGQVETLAARLPHPQAQIALARSRFQAEARALEQSFTRHLTSDRQRFTAISARLRIDPWRQELTRQGQGLIQLAARLPTAYDQQRRTRAERIAGLGRLLESYSYKGTLARGFVVLRDEAGALLSGVATLAPGTLVTLEAQDGSRKAEVLEEGGSPRPARPRVKPPLPKQESLF